MTDVRERRIPNRLVLVLLAAGLAFSIVVGPWPSSVLRALAGMGVGFGVWMPFYLLRMLGAGDVKFFAAASTWLGPGLALEAAALSALFGGLLALVWLFHSQGWASTLARVSAPFAPVPGAEGVAPSKARRGVPYGVAMAAGLTAAVWFPGLLR